MYQKQCIVYLEEEGQRSSMFTSCYLCLNKKDYLSLVTVYIFLTQHVCKAEDTAVVVGQSEPVVAIVGDDVILPFSLRTTIGTVSAVDESVELQRPDLKPKEVHFYRSREDYNDDQNPSYKGRTSLFKEEMKNGNISLKLSGVKLSDAGNYTCFVPTLRGSFQKDSVQLIVASKPQVTIVGVDDIGVILECEAGGLMYRPEMTWLDSDGNILPGGPTETGTDSDGRHSVRGHVTVQKTDNNMFICRVQQQQINQKMETQIHVPDQMFPERWSYWSQSYWWAWLIVGLAGGAVGHYFLQSVCNKIKKYNRKWNRDEVC